MRKKLFRIFLTFVLIFAILTGIAIWQNSRFTVTKYTVSSDRLPDSFIGFKIAQISDLHSRKWETLSEAVSSEEPDIILITGDLISRSTTDLSIALETARSLTEIAPVYYSSGNHDARNDGYASLIESLSEIGVTVLEGKSTHIEKGNDRIRLAGLGNVKISNLASAEARRLEYDAVLSELMNENSDFTILSAHHPELFNLYSAYSADLVFSGHAHGGAITLPVLGGIWAPGQGFLPKYIAGVYSSDYSQMVVSRGLSTSSEPFHLFTPFEVVICTLTQGELDLMSR